MSLICCQPQPIFMAISRTGPGNPNPELQNGVEIFHLFGEMAPEIFLTPMEVWRFRILETLMTSVASCLFQGGYQLSIGRVPVVSGRVPVVNNIKSYTFTLTETVPSLTSGCFGNPSGGTTSSRGHGECLGAK